MATPCPLFDKCPKLFFSEGIPYKTRSNWSIDAIACAGFVFNQSHPSQSQNWWDLCLNYIIHFCLRTDEICASTISSVPILKKQICDRAIYTDAIASKKYLTTLYLACCWLTDPESPALDPLFPSPGPHPVERFLMVLHKDNDIDLWILRLVPSVFMIDGWS